ncbi:unnamed protein product, partial [Ascophyllum nodosum]
ILGLDKATTFFGGSTTGASACRRVVRAKIFYATSLTTRNPTERFGAPKKSGEDSRFLEIIACSCLFIYMLQYGMMQKCCVRFATVMQKKSNAPCSSVFLSYSVHSCIWIPA